MDSLKLIELSVLVALIIVGSLILRKLGAVSIASSKKLVIIFASIIVLSFIAILDLPIREYFLASQTTQAVQTETNSLGQEFVKSLVNNSLTQEELIELNKRVSEHSTLDDPAPMYEFLKNKGIDKYLGSDLTPGISQNGTEYLGLRLWQIGLFMAMYNKHDVSDFLIDKDEENNISITLKKDKVQNNLDKMLGKSTFTVGKENDEDKVVNLSLFDDKFLKNLRFAQ